MRSPERFQRILASVSEVNSHDIDRVRHAEAIYLFAEDATLSAASSKTSSPESRSGESGLTALAALSTEKSK